MTPEEIDNLPYRPCVGVVVLNDDGQIFGGERIDTPGAWQMPQGGIDKGESARDAALRELVEETSIPAVAVAIVGESAGWLRYDLPAEVIPHRWQGRYRGQEQKWFLMQFSGQDSDVRIDTVDPEFSRWQWMSSEEMLESIVPFKRSLYADVFREFNLS
ncbi:RNA pyrophosphohydrolase [Algicella marina]|uniref:RNA pyrophosphohydrolase n=1 Tax=Algicella marina TaxID=2683284 RepID=A0A6P1T316_9RHOB|nr:RNA pyrophosphohydrolase [Algicella marina]QHQ36141.1 RNA pyrophosphohydrolase [Algicella marina]